MRIAFCSAEVFPFAKTGGLGDVCGALPIALERIGVKVDVFMPAYGCIARRKHKIKKIGRRLSHTTIGKNINVYLIESSTYFARQGIYGHAHGIYKDEFERFLFFNRQVLKQLKELGRQVDVIHCHDWHTSLIPVYLKETLRHDPFFNKTNSLLTIHNLAFQGLFPKEKFKKLGLDKGLFKPEVFEFYGKGNFLMAGIVYSDRTNTVSPQYAKEIQTKKFGCGLERVLRKNKKKLTGILNGIDYSVWEPSTDRHIYKRFNVRNYRSLKEQNKAYLQKSLALPVNNTIPLFGSVGRLSHQKGIDLMMSSIPQLMKDEVQIVIQGVGDRHYHRQLQALADRHPDKLAVCLKFDEKIAHQIYASSDFFMMPSNFEPCGLSQLISMNYGSVPVVYKTGGLVDTVIDQRRGAKKATGIIFDSYSRKGFARAIATAQRIFKDKKRMNQLINNGFRSRFSWENSAKAYKKIYQCLSSD